MNATRTHSNTALRRKKILLGAIVAVIMLGSVTLGVYLLVSYLWSSTDIGFKGNGQNVKVIGEEPFEDDEWMQQVAGHRELLGDGNSCGEKYEAKPVWIPGAELYAIRWLSIKREGGIAGVIGVKHSLILMEYQYIHPDPPHLVYNQIVVVEKTPLAPEVFDDYRWCYTNTGNLEVVCTFDKVQEMYQKMYQKPVRNLYESLAKNPKPLLWGDHHRNVRSTVPGILPYDSVHSNSNHYAASIWYMATLEREEMPNRDKINQLIHLPNPGPGRRMEFHCDTFGWPDHLGTQAWISTIENWYDDPKEYLRWYCLKKGWRNDPFEPHRFLVKGRCSWMDGPIVGPVGNQPYGRMDHVYG